MASNQSIVQGDYYFNGNLASKTMACPTGSVNDAAVAGAAGIQASKLQHQHEPTYCQPGATTAAAERQILHVVKGATAQVISFDVGAVVANIGAATVVMDLQKNGTTILTATITLDNGTAAYILKGGTLASTSLVAGDVLEAVVVSATAGGGTIAKGVFARLVVREDAQ